MKETDKEKIVVGQEFRTNLLSLVPGGSIVEVHYATRIKVYDNIKNPKAYIMYLQSNSEEQIIKVVIDGVEVKNN